jgi:GT2 family glycosyltransferase
VKMGLKVVIIILNWNGLKVTTDCIRSVKETCYSNFEVLLVDNGSTDGSSEILKETFPEIHYLQNLANLGYAEGNNRGIQLAFRDYVADCVVLLNNDTVVDSGWLQPLVDVVQKHPDVGAVGSKIYYYDKPTTIWCTGGSFGSWRGVPNQLRHNELDANHHEEPFEVDYASGCSMLITSNAYDEVGFLDADYFLYFEETDWCARAKRKGYKIFIAPRSSVWHKVGYSAGGEDSPSHIYYMVRNNYAFLARNTFGVKRYLKSFIFMCIVMKRYIFQSIGKPNYRQIFGAVWRGLRDGISGRMGPNSYLDHMVNL